EKNKHALKLSDNLIRYTIKKMIGYDSKFIKDEDKDHLTISFRRYYDEVLPTSIKKQITYPYFIKRCSAMGLTKPTQTAKTKRRIAAILRSKNKEKDDSEYLLIQQLSKINEKVQLGRLLNHHKYEFGEIVELDACSEAWIKHLNDFHIYLAVDSGTKKILSLYAEKEETTLGYMKLLEQLFARYGYPIGLKTDRRTTFFAKQENNTPMAKWLNSK
ncbi:hypothetical protein NXS15_03745, partial [Mycoplasma sp. CSL7475-4]|uniref:hypothetical protein n=1 Tax=Mycoplasma sp. CSL7475-4 TaxID=2973942 RepID=UPI00216AB599